MSTEEPEDLLSNSPAFRKAIHVLWGANGVDQLESWLKYFITLVEDILGIRENVALKFMGLHNSFLAIHHIVFLIVHGQPKNVLFKLGYKCIGVRISISVCL